MVFQKLSKHSGYRAQRPLSWFLLFLCALTFGAEILVKSAEAAPKVISPEPYPVGNLRITRENLAPTEYRFTLKNLNIAGAETNRARAYTWMIAGARGITPTVEIEKASYVHLRGGQVTSSTLEPPDQVKQNLVRVGDLGLFRQYWVYSFTVTTASPSGQDSFWVLDDASLVVKIGKPTAPLDEKIVGRWNSVFGEDRLAIGMLLNPDIPNDYYASDYNDPVETWSDWTRRINAAAQSGGLFRFSVYGGGLYRLSKADIETSTSKPINTPAGSWRVYAGGQEIAVMADPNGNGAEALFLPVASTELDGLQEQVFWLDTSAKDVKRQPPLRLSPMKPEQMPPDDAVTSTGSFSKIHRQFADYNPKMKPGPGADRWVWTDLDADAPETLDLVMPDYYTAAPGSNMRLSIRYGFTNFPPVQPSVLLLAGTAEAGQTSLTVQQGTATMDIDASLLRPGSNTIALRLVYPADSDAKRPVSIQSIRTDWTQELPSVNGDVATFTASSSVAAGSKGLRFSSSLSPDGMVVGFQNGAPSVISHEDNIAAWDEVGFSSFMVADVSSARGVPKLDYVAETPLLTDFESGRSVVISADELASASEALLPMHEASGLSARLYSTREIYDAFSYGAPDPSAIRNFLRYMFYKAPGDVPEYVTLVGEASDFRGDLTLVPPTTQENILPASAANSPEAPQGDQDYSSALGSDLVSDFLVGRIPAANEKQVSAFVSKMAHFAEAPAGEWSRLTQFVMDDNDEFPDVVGRIVSEAMSPTVDTELFRQWDFEYVPNLRVPGKKRSWTATETLIDDFNEGMGVLNFFGHGGPNLWSHERLLHLSDLPQITNSDRLPLITCASCDNAWISYPTPPVKASMGEQMVLKRDGGALALFGPVAGASPYEHSTLVQSLMEGVTRVQLRTVGDLILYAENIYYAVTRSASIPDQYLLLGDPTVQLPMPRVEPWLSGEVRNVPEGEELNFRWRGNTAIESTGTLVLLAGSGEDTLVRLPVNPGETEWSYVLPPDFGGGVIRALIETHANSKPLLGGATVSVMPPNATPDAQPELISREGTWYEIKVAEAGSSAANGNLYPFVLHTTTGTTAPVTISAVNHKGEKLVEVPRVEVTTATAGTRFDVNFPTPLDPPATTVSLQVFEVDEPSADPVTTVTYLIPASGTAELAFIPGSARVYTADGGDFVAGKTIFFEAELMNKGKVASPVFTLQALRENPTTGTELQTINDSSSYRVEGLAAGASQKVVFRWENTQAGSYPEVYLVANRNKVVREAEPDDNYIKIPEFDVLKAGNFSVADFQVSPSYALPGSIVDISAVLYNDRPANNHEVTIELGWGRSFDGETSSTRFPVQFEDRYATVTRQLVVPEHFAHSYIKVNADLEIEEADSGDNKARTPNMVITPLALDQDSSVSLTETIVAGVSYNLDMPFEGVMRVAPNYTSTTDYLVVDHGNITTGTASGSNDPNDNAWWVTPWRVAAAAGENVGEIGFRLPLETVQTDVPGMLRGYFIVEKGEVPTLDVKVGGGDWQRISPQPGEPRAVADFGELYSTEGSIEWNMRPAGQQPITLEYLKFTPRAVEWTSPPYLLAEAIRTQLLGLAVDTDDLASWEAMYLEWRSGKTSTAGSIDWTPWQSVPGWQAPLSSEEYLQVRILGVPHQDEKPYIRNIRLHKQ